MCGESVHGKFACCPRHTIGCSAKCHLISRLAARRRRSEPPQRAADWICGEPLAFLIEVNGQRIYIDSGGTPAQLPPNEHVDLAILGVALPDSRARLAAALAAPAAAICFTESSGRFLPAVERRISIWAAHRFPSCATRVCAAESQSLNSPGLFSAMDAAEGSRLQIPKQMDHR